jgi:uncharacterized membrane protein
MTFPRGFVLAVLLSVWVSLAQAPGARAQSEYDTAPPTLTLTTIDVPGAGFTIIWGINKSGEMVGSYGQSTAGDSHGFLYSNGSFTYFDYPGQSVTVPTGINDSGLVVGYATQDPGQGAPVYGFLYDGANFTTLQDGSDSATFSFGINNADVVVGRAGNLYAAKAFQMRNGRYKTINFPGQCPYGNAVGVNNFGEIAGYTSCGIYQYGYAVKNGKLQNIDFPGATETAAFGINDGGIIVGWYGIPNGCVCAFAEKGGNYISFSYAGATGTYASGINASGQIVGAYTDAAGQWHGFVSSALSAAALEGGAALFEVPR